MTCGKKGAGTETSSASYRNFWHTGLSEELIEFGDIISGSALLAKSEYGPLFGSRQSDEEGRYALKIARHVSPPCFVVEPYENDRVIFEPFTFVDSHQRSLIYSLECIEASCPARCAIGGHIKLSRYIAVVLSMKSIDAPWVKKELDVAMNREIASGEIVVLPLLYEPCELPEFLKGKLYADFSKPEDYEEVLAKLLRRLRIA